MRRCFILILLVSCLLPTSFAQKESLLQLVAYTDGKLQLTFQAGDCMVAPLGESGALLSLAGTESTAEREGLPSLPTMSRLLLLPKGSRATVESVRCGSDKLLSLGNGRRLVPWAGATIKNQPHVEAEPDKEVYHLDRFWSPAFPVELRHLGTLRNHEVLLVSVHPAAYHPAKAAVRLTADIAATLTITLPADLPPLAAQPERLLLVSRPEFREGLQPFVRWKRMTGYDVREVYVATADHDSVKAAIAPLWSGHPDSWPRYLLIVGDASQIEPFTGTSRPTGVAPHATDLYYAEHTGDYLPDASFGRWPVNDTAELRTVVEKNLRYEQALDLDTHAMKRLLVVAGAEQRTPAPTTTNGQVYYVSREAKTAHPDLDTLCWGNPESETLRGEILHEVGRGAAVLNYTAHCTSSGWTAPSVTFHSVDTLPSSLPMFYVNNCCESNRFEGTCFGEQLLRKPAGGAIGVIGATNVTLWNEDYYWAVGPKYPFSITPAYDSLRPGAFDRWIGRTGGVESQGDFLLAGNLAVTASGSRYDKFYWEIYCLLGDPSLSPYVGTPRQASVAATGGLEAGSTSLVLAGTAGTRIAVVQGDSLLASALMPASGQLTLYLRESLDTGTLTLTASGCGFRPHVHHLRVAPPRRRLGFHQLHTSDSTLLFVVANHGSDTLRDITIRLLQDSVDIAAGAAVAADPLGIALLSPGQRLSTTMRHHLASVGPSPQATGRLAACDTALLGSLPLTFLTPATYPTLELTVAAADSNETALIERGQSYLFHATPHGRHDSLRLSATLLPSGRRYSCQGQWLPFFIEDGTQHVQLSAEIHLGRWQGHHIGYLAVAPAADGFEEGFGCYPWHEAGSRPWTIDSTEHHSGRFSARSGAIDYRQTSDLVLTATVLHPSNMTFYVKTSCEETYDKLVFSIDGVAQRQAWGETGWIRCQVPVAEGRHEFRWRYVKDESTSAGSDCAWIDDIQMPFALWDTPAGCSPDGNVGIPASTTHHPIALHPNPTTGLLQLTGLDAIQASAAELFDIHGRRLLSLPLNGPASEILDLTHLPNGLYLLRIAGESQTRINKVIINR